MFEYCICVGGGILVSIVYEGNERIQYFPFYLDELINIQKTSITIPFYAICLSLTNLDFELLILGQYTGFIINVFFNFINSGSSVVRFVSTFETKSFATLNLESIVRLFLFL